MTANKPDATNESATNRAAGQAATNSDGGGDSPAATTTAKLASAAHTAVDVAAKKVEKAEHTLRDVGAGAGDKVHEAALSLSEATLGTVKAYVHQYPLRSVCIALATGYLLTAIVKK